MTEDRWTAAAECSHAGGNGHGRDPNELLSLVYSQLRHLARARMADVPPGNTLQPTALVHEAILRVLRIKGQSWNGPGHFFGAAAQAMRDLLVEQSRRKAAHKNGGKRRRLRLNEEDLPAEAVGDDVVALEEALQELARSDRRKIKLVMLRHFAGLTFKQTAKVMGLSVSTVEREWRFTRAWLYTRLRRLPANV